jgi:acetyl esterase/lipase
MIALCKGKYNLPFLGDLGLPKVPFVVLPPIMIQAGSDELLLSDSKSFAENARAAGVTAIFEVWEGMQHGWQFADGLMPESRQAIDHIGWVVQGQFGFSI